LSRLKALRWAVSCLIAAGTTIAATRRLAGQEEAVAIAGGQMVRGVVAATASDHLAIKTEKGEAYRIAFSSNTRIVKDQQPIRIAAIKPGDTVGVMGVLDAPNHTVHALFVVMVDAEQAKQAREALGKLFIAGKVTAIAELKLTVQRPDGVSQVIAVDESTSFRRGGRQLQSVVEGSGPAGGSAAPIPVSAGGESITLADIKVGDTVAGKGELKHGIFVPSQLAVGDASERQRR